MDTIYDEYFFNIFISPLRKCINYTPKLGLGHKKNISLEFFLDLYSRDPLYSWCGLNSELMYTAHRAAGGMTSIYRQLGIGCENLFREIIIKSTGYTKKESARWAYSTKTKSGKNKILTLDGRLELNDIQNLSVRKNTELWIKDYCHILNINPIQASKGAIFEVRQGYKSKDSKRQNGDIDNVAVAWASGYLPIFAIFSSQIDKDNELRYHNNKAGILIGKTSGTNNDSLFLFCKNILNFDIEKFF